MRDWKLRDYLIIGGFNLFVFLISVLPKRDRLFSDPVSAVFLIANAAFAAWYTVKAIRHLLKKRRDKETVPLATEPEPPNDDPPT